MFMVLNDLSLFPSLFRSPEQSGRLFEKFQAVLKSIANEEPWYYTNLFRSPEQSGRLFENFQAVLKSNVNGQPWYYTNIDKINEFIASQNWELRSPNSFSSISLIQAMISHEPQERPTAKELVAHFGSSKCCISGREPLEAMEKDE
ncbi:hypothetical protein EJ02DRAFT_242559 [Clathrospora elynae]|uniref:Protein kinase domain-containing protein n=1 Tax=Clathrospora elynae TaxID=706981 RepID=A0A6A5SJZ7_9PLEO|nr:hypothetical protein EJ02DRAFT_242559 [Clathrospora elynae]